MTNSSVGLQTPALAYESTSWVYRGPQNRCDSGFCRTNEQDNVLGDLSLLDIIIPEFYLLWGLGHYTPPKREWYGPSGMCVRGKHSAHSPPFARSRAILAFLATRALEAGSTFSGNLTDIAGMFDLRWPVGNIAKHFLQVANAEFECTDGACGCAPFPCKGVQPIAYGVRYCPLTHAFRITLSEEFLLSARFGIRCPRPHVAALLRAGQLAALDLLIWFCWQIQRRTAASVYTLGPHGPFQYIKSAETPTRKRDEIVRLHQEVAKEWPDCPYRVSDDGNKLTYTPPTNHHIASESTWVIDIDLDDLEPAETIGDIQRRNAQSADAPVADRDKEQTSDEILPAPRKARQRKPPMTIPVRRFAAPTPARKLRVPRFPATTGLFKPPATNPPKHSPARAARDGPRSRGLRVDDPDG